MKSLHDVYRAQLQDAYSACRQALPVTTALGKAASDKALSEALIAGAKGITEGMENLQTLCNEHGINPRDHFCEGMEGLTKEAQAHALKPEFEDASVRDAMIITQYQRLAHYAIAAYGSLRAFANRLNLDGDAAKLSEMLDSAYSGDRTMSQIAEGSNGINAVAA